MGHTLLRNVANGWARISKYQGLVLMIVVEASTGQQPNTLAYTSCPGRTVPSRAYPNRNADLTLVQVTVLGYCTVDAACD
jgi:hypothetical protein